MIEAGTNVPPDFLGNHLVDRNDNPRVNETVLENDGFFPDIALADFQKFHQVNDDYSLDHRIDCLNDAMLHLNGELRDAQCDWVRNGYPDLDSVPQGYIGDSPEKVAAYRRAVYCFALMLMAERFRSTDTTQHGSNKAFNPEGSADTWQRHYNRHVYAVLGQPGVEMEGDVI